MAVSELSPAVLRELERLGATLDMRTAVRTEVETHIGVQPLAAGVACFAYGVTWPEHTRFCARRDPDPEGVAFETNFEMDRGGADPNHFGGIGVVEIGADDGGFMYVMPVDGEGSSDDPPVYRVDHAGPYELESGAPLSEFLASLMSEGEPLTEADLAMVDPRLARAIYRALGAERKLDAATLARVTTLALDVHDVETLDGIEACTSLSALSLHGMRIKGIPAVARLTRLEELSLPWDCKDLRPLSALTGLRRLSAGVARNVAPLAGLTRLEYLGTNGDLASLTGVAKLRSLRELRLSGCSFDDLSPLRRLPLLEYLRAKAPRVTDLGPLSALERLRSIDLCAGEVETLEPLARLLHLEELRLQCPRLPDPAPLAGLSSLRVLELPGAGLEDVGFIARIEALERVGFARNAITDVAPLARLPGLREVDLSANRITDIRPFLEAEGLAVLQLRNNPFDRSKAANARVIEELQVRGVQLFLDA
jgi:Leucine-rich repeat (LRR) protein